MEVNDLRSALDLCEQMGELVRVGRHVDPLLEVPSILNAVGRQPNPCAVLFENVDGYPAFRLAGKLLGGPERFGQFYGLPQDFKNLKNEFLKALRNPLPPRVVSAGPCKDNVVTKNIDIGKIIPPVNGALGVNSLYYQPVVITRHPTTGAANMAIYRAAIQGPNQVTVNARTDRHGGLQVSSAKNLHRPLPVALVIGVEPMIYVTANAKLPYGHDELSYAGALKKQPVDVVKCETIDLEVPAHAEVIVEGEFRPPFELGEEGPWPEYLRYLGMPIRPPIMHVTAITYRNNPINYVVIPGSGAGEAAFGLGNQAQFLKLLKEFAADFVVDSFLTPSTAQHHGIINVNKTEPHHEGLQINVALAAFNYSPYLDAVTVVDEDINIYDLAEVDWAICTRCNPAKQLHILPEGRSHQINPIVGVRELDNEPLAKAKMIVDATIPWNYKVREVSPGVTFFTKTQWQTVELSDYMSNEDVRKLQNRMSRNGTLAPSGARK